MKNKEITITGTEKNLISLDYRLPKEATGPIVLFVHGFNGFKDWGDLNLISDEFAKNGMPFVKFNFSHNGTTPEDLTNFVDKEAYKTNTLSKELNDLYIVLNWVEKQFAEIVGKSLPIVLMGHSRGACECILFTSRRQKHIEKLVTLAAPAYADIPWHNWPREKMFDWQKTGFTEIEHKRTKQKMLLGLDPLEDYENHKASYDVLKAADAITCPWLICHGTEDDVVLPENAEKLKDVNPEAEIYWVPEAGHTFNRVHPHGAKSLSPEVKTLVAKIIDFLRS